MRHVLITALCFSVVIVLRSDAQAPETPAGPELASILDFEVDHAAATPRGWGGGPAGTFFVDGETVHTGRWSARIERNSTSPEMFSTITKAIPIGFGGTSVEYRGFLRTEDVTEFTGLWLREDSTTGSPVAFDNMQQRQIKGTHGWTEYSITLPLRPEARQLVFGVLMRGTGKVWADDLRLLVDGKPVWDAPKAERVQTILDTDHEFDSGSRIDLAALTPLQTQNLAMLGKVWGFVKYHHPVVAAGKRQWDYELFRVTPKVLAAQTRSAAQRAMSDWIRGLGDIVDCTACATPRRDDVHFDLPFPWLNDEATLGLELTTLLRSIHRNRSRDSKFYISQVAGVGNPAFEHELAYPNVRFPDPGYQLLGLYRYWNIIEYWYPNRNLLDQDWDTVLAEFIPRITLARNKDAYQLELIQLIGRITDTHANLNVPTQVLPPAGTCQLPIVMRFIGKRAVVTDYSEPKSAADSGIRVGDVIESLDGEPVQQLVARSMPYYPGSNEAARLQRIARSLTRGSCSRVEAGIRRENGLATVSAERVPIARLNASAGTTHDRPGETFQLLADDVAYLKLSSVKAADVAGYINRSRDTKGLIIDIRNYPAEFVVFALGSLLVDRPTPFARFTAGDLDNPGTFYWTGLVPLMPQSPHYAGKIAILVDEVSISQSEYTAMAFRTAPGAIVVGSTTAGADGNVSSIPLPGGLNTLISGIGVFYPDKRPTQRIGIVPDIEVTPTIEGIRAGRDEVLEEAIRQILKR